MRLRLLLIAIVLYLVFKTASNLVRAVLNDPKAPPRVEPNHRREPDLREWQGPSSRPAQRRRDDDIEDARWVDL